MRSYTHTHTECTRFSFLFRVQTVGRFAIQKTMRVLLLYEMKNEKLMYFEARYYNGCMGC